MSGGHFDNRQYNISMIIEDIEAYIASDHDLPDDIIQEFKNGIKALEVAYVYTKSIDYLISDDYGPDSFRENLKNDLERIDL